MFNKLLIFISLLSIVGCMNETSTPRDTTTTGNISVAVDENFYPIIDSQIQVFNATYPKAKVTATYGAEADIVSNFLKDTSRVIVIGRKLSKNEMEIITKNVTKPREVMIAKDAIALIINKENIAEMLTVQDVKKILNGTVTNWKTINKAAIDNEIQVVFDNKNSGTVRYMMQTVTDGKPFGAKSSAVNNSQEVINFVEKNKNALGIIGVNWISDMDDPQQQAFMKNIKVVSVAENELKSYVQPYQAYIAMNKYPFTREVYAISRDMYNGLGRGFSTFMASHPGQLIILKSGIVPAQSNLEVRSSELN